MRKDIKNKIKKIKKYYEKRTRIEENRIKRREREVEGGNIKKIIRACNVVLCLLRVYCIDCKYQAVSTPPQLPQSWGQLCPGRGRCDENASLPLI